ncbi:ABC transporter permease [Chloroflexota bacterium]
MLQMRRIWFLALKDLRLFATDRIALLMFVLFPFLFITMFTLMNTGVSDPRLELYLTTRETDYGLSQQIIGAMETQDDSQLAPGEPKVIWIQEYDEALRMVEDKEMHGFLAFPVDFTDDLLAGDSVQLEIVADAGDINTRAALNGLAAAISSRVGSQQVAIRSAIELLQQQGDPAAIAGIEQLIQQIISGQGGAAPEEAFIEFTTEKVGEVEAENASNWTIPGYLVMFVFFAAALSAEAIVRERQNNTLERLMASSVRRNSILAGVFTGTTAKGLTQIIIFWVVGILVFKTELGSAPAAVIILSFLMVIVSSAFGVMLATLVSTQRAASSIGVLASLVMAPLGGCWWPLFILPRWMQNLAKITPHGWATTGFNKLMLFGADFGDVAPEMLALIVFAAIFGVIAAWRFRTSSV